MGRKALGALSLQDSPKCESGWDTVDGFYPESRNWLNGNVNQDAQGGMAKYLCMHNVWPGQEEKKIWQLLLIGQGDNCASKGHGFHAVRPIKIDYELSVDLNQGTGGKEIYLCQSHSKQTGTSSPIRNLGLSKTRTCPDSYELVKDDRLDGNLNQGNGGAQIYLCLSRANAN